jgi:large subunit ribosomal protein L7/L12
VGDEASGQEAEETKSKYDLVLESAGDRKIMVIKAVREISPGLGLAEAKAVVDGAPKTIVQGMKTEEAQAAKAKLEQAGATVSLK